MSTRSAATAAWCTALCLAIARVEAAPGDTDPDFGVRGMATARIGVTIDTPRAVAVQADGKILVAGQSVHAGSITRFTVLRFNADGSRDVGYHGGNAVVDVRPLHAERSHARALALQEDGKAIVAGRFSDSQQHGFVLVRLNSDGSPDSSFGEQGIVAFRAGSGDATWDEASALLVQPDGRIVVAGWAGQVDTYGTAFVVFRLNSDGSHDRTFGDHGKVSILFGNAIASLYALALQPDGKLVAVGAKDAGGEQWSDLILVRLGVDGRNDETFGSKGIVVRSYGRPVFASGLAVLPTGKLVVALDVRGRGSSLPAPDLATRTELLRFHTDGRLDATFGSGGVSVVSERSSSIHGLFVELDGSMFVAGFLQTDSASYHPVIKFSADGSIDDSFGKRPANTYPIGNFSALDRSPDGRYVVAGSHAFAPSPDPWVGQLSQFAVLRVSTDDPVAVEYYHARLDHYFVTADPGEIAKLDAGAHSGWARTGYRFSTGNARKASATSPVCRFYGKPEAGLDSHFYSASLQECDETKQRFADSWSLESEEVFRMAVPDTAGQCPSGTRRIYRAWNNRRDSNHRYTTDRAVHLAMLAKGYVAEGHGAGVVMCSP